MRGDPPEQMLLKDARLQSTPHARGSTRTKQGHERSDRVYPACAGIHPGEAGRVFQGSCLPRMRGDPPMGRILLVKAGESTPHARGSTVLDEYGYERSDVYPACAGIHPASY